MGEQKATVHLTLSDFCGDDQYDRPKMLSNVINQNRYSPPWRDFKLIIISKAALVVNGVEIYDGKRPKYFDLSLTLQDVLRVVDVPNHASLFHGGGKWRLSASKVLRDVVKYDGKVYFDWTNNIFVSVDGKPQQTFQTGQGQAAMSQVKKAFGIAEDATLYYASNGKQSHLATLGHLQELDKSLHIFGIGVPLELMSVSTITVSIELYEVGDPVSRNPMNFQNKNIGIMIDKKTSPRTNSFRRA